MAGDEGRLESDYSSMEGVVGVERGEFGRAQAQKYETSK